MPSFIGALDQGTTSTRFLIVDEKGVPVASHQVEFEQIYPQSGWHEHDPIEIFTSCTTCIDEAVKEFESKGNSKSDIVSIGITTQRETVVVWDSESDKPICNAIAWPDTRTAGLVRELKKRKGADGIQDICGLPISTYPSAVKLAWLLEYEDDVKKVYEKGQLVFGTVDTWLVYMLNGGKKANVHVTDTTNASRTQFMDLRKGSYSETVLKFYGLDTEKCRLPKIVPSSSKDTFGKISEGALKGVPIMGLLGDQSAALVGQCGFNPGEAKNTYGTGCFLLYNVGEEPVMSSHGLLATIAYHIGDKPTYALEGSIAVAGSGVTFLIKNLNIAKAASKISELAESVPDNGGVVFVTAFSGLFAPYWIDDAKGTIFGITAHTSTGHIARATLEATCFQTKAILDAMEQDSGEKLKTLKVDGGMSQSDLCMQTQSDLLALPISRPAMSETTCLGAAFAAGLAAGVWKSFDELRNLDETRDRTTFEPKMAPAKSDAMYTKWKRAVEMCRGWVQEGEETQ